MKNLKRVILVTLIITALVTLNAQEKSQERIAREHLVAGDSLFTAKNYDKAIGQYEISLKTFYGAKNDMTPFEEEIKVVLYKLYASGVNAKNYNKASEYGMEFLKYDPSNEAVVKNLSRIFRIELKNIPSAIQVWKDYDNKYNSFVAKQEIADLYGRNNNMPEAIKWFYAALQINKDAEVLQKMASLYINNKEPQKAIAVYEDFLATNPSDRDKGRTFRNMGTLFKDLKNNAKAIENYELALGFDYDRSISLWLVTQYYDSNRFDHAISRINDMLKRNANDADATYFKALILFQQEKFSEARTEFTKVQNHANYGTSAKQHIEIINKKGN